VVTVRETPAPEADAPVVALETLGTEGASGWFVSPVTVRATASDDRDVRMRMEIAAGAGDWRATEDAHRVDAVVSEEGTTQVRARATDAAGKVSDTVAVDVRIDTVAPTVTGAFDPATRSVAASATDGGSGVELIEYAVDGVAEWRTYADPVILDGARHVVHLRARDAAGNVSALSSTAVPLSPDAPLSGNIAPIAGVTASYTSGWNSLTAVNDESLTGASWGTWPNIGEQWVQLAWDREVTIDRAGVLFFRDQPDSADAGMIPPRAWRLQYFDAATDSWVDVAADAEYARSSDEVNEVGFAPITTSRIRALMQSWGSASGGGSSGILEFQAWAAEPPVAIDAELSVTSRCVAGSAVLVVTAKNADSVPLTVEISTPFGTKSVAPKAGASVNASFSTRAETLPAGTATAVASGSVDGTPVSLPLSADYSARSCR
jgi:hypothetical protein